MKDIRKSTQKCDSISEILRTEIIEHKRMRHDLVIKKFSAITIMLGLGSLPESVQNLPQISLVYLLYIVPFVAIAFDIYIFNEDYRVKRAGMFINAKAQSVTRDEKEWEKYTVRCSNKLASVSFVIVTIIYFLCAAFVLSEIVSIGYIYFLWTFIVILSEVIIIIIQLALNKKLSRKLIEN